jgi:hypothetical protein
MDNKNFIPPFFYFELGGHLGWKSGSPNTIELLPILTDYAN